MRTELTYVADAMARYNGKFSAAFDNVQEYYLQGGLSVEYFNRVVHFMNLINVARLGGVVPKRIIKAIRRKMPRVHTEISNWRLTYHSMMEDAANNRKLGRKSWAKADIRGARHIRQIYL